jgi:carboxyl-terminal processing protease
MMKTLSKIFNFAAKYGWSMTLILLAAFALGFTWSSSDQLYSNIRLFDRIALMVSENYVEDVDEERMIKVAIDAMLSKLDNYTKFLRGADYVRLKQETDGHFDGIGVSMEFHRDTLTVVSVLEGTPGFRMGLKPGDRILKIDSTSTFNLDQKDVRMLMWGPSGTAVDLQIRNPEGKERQVSVKRENVEIRSVPYYSVLENDVGYIRITHFSENCLKDVKAAVRDLKKRAVKSLILDLRGNPGGLLLEAIDVAGLFLPENSKIVETRGRKSALIGSYISSQSPVFLEGELAVLVDNQTASAAEILAGAIQDHDRGIVIGAETYGKGLVQQVMQFSDDTALKITTSKYYLPSGRCLQKPDWSTFELAAETPEPQNDSLYFTVSGRTVFGGGGIMPDIYVEGMEESDYVAALKKEACFFDFAIEYLKDHDVRDGFTVSSRDMREFKEFVARRGFAFLEEDRIAFNELKEKLTLLDDETREALITLEKKLDSNETWRFENHYSEIKSDLKEEVVVRAKGEQALYEDIWLEEHDEIKRAGEILSNSEKYLSILASR